MIPAISTFAHGGHMALSVLLLSPFSMYRYLLLRGVDTVNNDENQCKPTHYGTPNCG